MTNTQTAALPWVVLDCPCTHILGEYATEAEAEAAAKAFGRGVCRGSVPAAPGAR